MRIAQQHLVFLPANVWKHGPKAIKTPKITFTEYIILCVKIIDIYIVYNSLSAKMLLAKSCA